VELFKKHFTLIIGIAIPLVMILLVATSIYLPGFFVQPEFNFLYVTGEDRYWGYSYSVEDGPLTREYNVPDDDFDTARSELRLFIYDVTHNESREVTFEEAVQLQLDPDKESPDGFEVTYGSRGENFLFMFGSYTDYNSQYLVGRGVSKKLDLDVGADNSYYGSFKFLGWILP
jgi:hypothetical protein